MSVRSAIHDWWPIAAFLSFVLLIQALLTNSVVANGKHASDHLQSAEVIFPVAFFLAVIFWGAREARKHANAWVAGVIVGLAFLVVTLGNLRVIWAIGGESWTDAQAGALGPARPGFDSAIRWWRSARSPRSLRSSCSSPCCACIALCGPDQPSLPPC